MQDSTQTQPLAELDINANHLTLLGTAHVSKASAEAVATLINSGEYDIVAIELCPARHQSIVNPNHMAEMDLFAVIKNKKASMVAASLALGAYQQRLSEQFGIRPGEEMMTAIELTQAQAVPLKLIDRDIGVTLKRIYSNIPWWRKLYVVSGLAASVISNEKVSEQQIENLKSGDMLESTFAQFSDSADDLFRPLISERDEFMAAKLTQLCHEHRHKKILAIIGAGHLAGIQQQLASGVNDPAAQLQQLNFIPKGRQLGKLIPWLIVALVLAGFALGFSQSQSLGWNLVLDWVVINGGLSALGAALAGAHIGTVLTAFVAAPLTSLNPTIGAGMVTAGAELYLRKPTIKDFENVRKDTARLAGWRHNRVARLLLVFLFSTVGSVAGTYIAGFQIFEALTSIE